MRPIGYDGNNPTSVAEWLESLELGDYTKTFLINGYTSMELVKKIWEIELINVSLRPAATSLYKYISPEMDMDPNSKSSSKLETAGFVQLESFIVSSF